MQVISFTLYTQGDPQKVIDSLIANLKSKYGGTVRHVRSVVTNFHDCGLESISNGFFIWSLMHIAFESVIPDIKDLFRLPNVIAVRIKWPSSKDLTLGGKQLPCVCPKKEKCNYVIYDGQRSSNNKRPRTDE